MSREIRVRSEMVVIPTYEPAPPDRNPMFLEKRVYQGSSGKVYPLPFYNRIAEEPTPHSWSAIYLDNGLVEVMLLPEIGGRIHAIKDLTNNFDVIYRQSVIKPALVGLAGPWISGGIEFNWPQHHRPSTFMPAQHSIEEAEDGSITVWMGEHDPLDRTKGMHGICLHPDSSVVEIKVRLYNRTPYVQTFLWWSNIGVRVHEAYKSFFPPDAHVVADHAKRALSAYPLCEGFYYGVDYGERGRSGVPEADRPSCFLPAHSGGNGPLYSPNDLSWYANIPVPTSYMCGGTEEDFFGGYDFFKGAGLIHIADHHISPGKKQWTWGNHEFGYAWDRNLTDTDGPYIELMAGVYTDNQPDFSFMAPGETRTFSQFLYPYQGIGPAHAASIDAALSLTDGRVGVAATRAMTGKVRIAREGSESLEVQVELAPDKPFITVVPGASAVSLFEGDKLVLTYEPKGPGSFKVNQAQEPPLPSETPTNDELFVIGQHLSQYRHATRSAADYWREALSRDPGDVRCGTALGQWHFKRGEFEAAVHCFEKALERATSRNPNPYDGEPLYNLGLALRFLGRDKEAYDAFAKSAWNAAWQGPAWHAMAEIRSSQGLFDDAVTLLEKALRKDSDNLRAACLRSMLLQKLGKEASVESFLILDNLDAWGCYLESGKVRGGNQIHHDLVIDLMRAGLNEDALTILNLADHSANDGTVPMLWYYKAALLARLGQPNDDAFIEAKQSCPDYCFPARLEDIAVLSAAPPDDARAAFYLGCLLYDKRRHHEATELWQKAVSLEPGNAKAFRCLGIAAFNVLNDPQLARECYDSAITADPTDSRLWYERDQLWKRLGVLPEMRLSELEKRRDLVAERDDLTIEFCALLNLSDRHEESAAILMERRFQPWEGGEGQALGIFTRTHLALSARAREAGDSETALSELLLVLNPPQNLGEARHLLANASELWLALGDAFSALGRNNEAQAWWQRAADFKGDFQEMAVQAFSELTYFQALALRRLGRIPEAEQLLENLHLYALDQLQMPAKIDYFATSLPTMLLFEDDLKARQDNRAKLILAQVALERGESAEASRLLQEVLAQDPSHALARELVKMI